MPVEEHEVHESVRHSADKLYGCNSNKRLQNGYWLQEREYRQNGTYIMMHKFIPHKMSVDCRNYYLWYSDPGCRGCNLPKDREYAQRMQSLS